MTASSVSNVVSLSGRTNPLSDEEFEAAVRVENERHVAALAALARNYAGGRAGARRGVPIAERRDSKKQAAGELKMTEQQLTRLLVRYHDTYPDRPRLAVQPARLKSSRWTVYTDRVRAIIESGEPY